MIGRAWICVTIDGPRQYAGNLDYQDVPESIYKYDSAVGNSRQISVGDVIALRNRDTLIGVGLINKIDVKNDQEKMRFRCPECRTTAIKERRSRSPKFRCAKGHLFNNPIEDIAIVTKYEAYYNENFVALDNQVSASELRKTALRPSTQNSIEEVDADKLAVLVVSKAPKSREIFERFFQRNDVFSDERPSEYMPSTNDHRKAILRSIMQRHGQSKFKAALKARYGNSCMLTGSAVEQVVEAAHIWPYRGEADNHPENGLLLRSDIHTLFDLNLIALEPETLALHISAALHGSEYAELAGVKLSISNNHRPSKDALELRWKIFMPSSD